MLPYFSGGQCEDYEEMLRVANLAVAAIERVSGEKWDVGNAEELLKYRISGGNK